MWRNCYQFWQAVRKQGRESVKERERGSERAAAIGGRRATTREGGGTSWPPKGGCSASDCRVGQTARRGAKGMLGRGRMKT
jgi:hypothetical protein